jgi:hypothetical protein
MDLQKLALEVIKNDSLIKRTKLQLDQDKKDLIECFNAENVGSVKINGKTVSLASRSNKVYNNPEIQELELQIKSLKAIADIRGEFQIESVTRFIQVR